MKGDFSRLTFDPRKRYTGVRLQQGRVQLDADWNEQVDIATYLQRTLARDLLGASGGPSVGGGFDITVTGGKLMISPGHYWVDGILCENDAALDINQQPDLPDPPVPTNPQSGWYMAYLDVWERGISAVEDPDLLEIALGGPDTATRTRTVWQVKLQRLGSTSGNFTCASFQPPALAQPLTLSARTLRVPEENQLYRVEVHKAGGLGTATFKWSRDNGSVAALAERPGFDPDNLNKLLIVRQTGPDRAGGFAADQWIEITDEPRLLTGQSGVLAQLSAVNGQELIVTGWPSGGPPALSGRPVIRRWDSNSPTGELPVERPTTNDGYLALEGGLEVRFEAPVGTAQLLTGDFWTIPVRAGAGALWPQDGNVPARRPPMRSEHHYAPLRLLLRKDNQWARGSSCRNSLEKLNRNQNDTMTASLTITGNLAVQGTLTVAGRPIGAPVFVKRFDVAHGGNSHTKDWTRYVLPSSSIPAGIRAVILEAEVAKNGPNSGTIDGYLAIRRTSGASEDLLVRARAAGGGDAIAWSNQGMFPVQSDNSFEYAIQGSGFDDWKLRVIGYFP